MLKLVHISDTHGRHTELTESIPNDTDILVHSGDWSFYEYPEETEAFLNWLREMPGKHKILIAGNHDSRFDISRDVYSDFDLEGIHYLFDQSIEIEGIHFYGSPFVQMDFEMSFTYFNAYEAVEIWEKIPDETEVLITHGPAQGILDIGSAARHFGCEVLNDRIQNLKKLKYHLFGHIHESKGVLEKGGVTFSNAATGLHIHEIDNRNG